MNKTKALPLILILLLSKGYALAAETTGEKGSVKKLATSRMIKEFIKNFNSLENTKAYFAQVFEKTLMIIQNPTQFRNEIVLIVGILVALLLIFVIVMLMWSAMRRQSETRQLVADVRTKRGVEVGVARVTFSLTTCAFIFLISYFWTTSPSFCSNCHQVENSYKTWMTAEHKTVACLGCHSEPGVSGYLRSQFDGFDNLLRFKLSGNVKLRARVKNEACLKCHSKIYDRIRPSGIVMRHKDVIDAGISCTDCHPATSHAKTQKKFFVMDKCVVCHDGEQAKADCQGCHKEDIASRKNLKIEDFPKVRNAGIRCYTACHTNELIKLCMDCHGLIMPHPSYFQGIHAYVSSKRPLLCNRCHSDSVNTTEKTCSCHISGDVHGDYSKWFPMHSREGYKLMGGSCTCHKGGFCSNCHNNNQNRNNY